jgi:hypothetical protein
MPCLSRAGERQISALLEKKWIKTAKSENNRVEGNDTA